MTIVHVVAMILQKSLDKGWCLMNKKQLDFTVFCIENVAEKLEKNGTEIYEMLSEKSQILDEYIIPYYDVLHTQGKEYIVNDLLEQMKKAGLLL